MKKSAVLAKMIKENRKRLGLSQKELGEKLGIGQGQVSHWETAKFPVPTKHHKTLSKRLKIALDQFSNK